MRRPHDTSPAAWSRQLEAFRAMPARDRVRLALEMSEEVRQIGLAGQRHRNEGRSRTGMPHGSEAGHRA
ncbi:MAG TPA: hypothetical protein VM451_02615 [Candidatus Limnocylindria bacterium]|nr:hypothetical protein [Candidatus Limnocylindria bacterium]